MTTYRLFSSVNGPAAPAAYSGPFIAGLAFSVSTGGTWLDGYWWWVCDSGQSTTAQKFALWQVHGEATGSLIATGILTSGTLVAGQWNYVPLPNPVPLCIGVTYVAATGFSNSFPATTGEFGAGEAYGSGIVSGPLIGYSDQGGSLPAPFSLSQGSFSTASSDPTAVMPVYGYESDNFWMDVQVDTVGPAGTSYRLWPTYPVIPGQPSIDTNQQTTGTQFFLSGPCVLNNLWFYSPPGVSVLPTRCGIWDVSTRSVVAGTDNTSPAWTGDVGSGWVACAYEGVTLPAGNYKAVVYSGGGSTFYQENTHYFSSPQISVEDVAKSLTPSAWWELADAAGSTIAADSSGNGNAGSVNGGVTFGGAGPLEGGTTAAFNGTTGFIATGLNFSASWTALSFAAWMRIPAGSAQVSGVVGNNNAASAGGANLVVSNSGGDLEIQLNIQTSAGATSASFVTSTAWADGNWHHVAVTWNGSTVSCYLDAEPVGTSAVTGTLTAGSSDVTVGNAGGNNYFLGSLAHALVTDSALAAADVVALFHPAAYVTGPGWNGITAGPLSSPNILTAAAVTGNSTGLAMTGNSTYSTYNEGYIYPTLYDVNDDGENRWIDVEVTPSSSGPPPPQPPVNSGAFLVFFP
jgi:Concanavalin A-like lectin/glucanases superfamily